MTTRALVSGRIIKHNGHALVILRSGHATAHAVSALTNNGPGSTKDALDFAADKLTEHSTDLRGVLDFDVNGRLYA